MDKNEIDKQKEKFKAKQTINPYAKFIFNANELPKVADKTNGFYRRIHIIPFEAQFSKEDNKNFNFDALVTPQALEYFARISLEAYMNMKLDFANYEESDAEVEQYKIENNNVLIFLNDIEYMKSFISTNTSTKKKSEVYAAYKEYCRENEFKPVGKKSFYSEISKSKMVEEKIYQGTRLFKFNLEI